MCITTFYSTQSIFAFIKLLIYLIYKIIILRVLDNNALLWYIMYVRRENMRSENCFCIYNNGGTVEISGTAYLSTESNARAAVQNLNGGTRYHENTRNEYVARRHHDLRHDPRNGLRCKFRGGSAGRSGHLQWWHEA